MLLQTNKQRTNTRRTPFQRAGLCSHDPGSLDRQGEEAGRVCIWRGPISVCTFMAVLISLPTQGEEGCILTSKQKNRSKIGLKTSTPNEGHSQWSCLTAEPSGQDSLLSAITLATGLQHVTFGGTFPTCSRDLPEKLEWVSSQDSRVPTQSPHPP